MTPRNWIAVASADHARRGRDAGPPGFMQVCHGKRLPLERVSGGDRVAYYAPATVMRGRDRLQSFVAIGLV
ncbi:MAG: EVE domain-containing protein, partial [Azonexus sp.]|nr:EVE domain-containing protein [Azonexus sp.]